MIVVSSFIGTCREANFDRVKIDTDWVYAGTNIIYAHTMNDSWEQFQQTMAWRDITFPYYTRH